MAQTAAVARATLASVISGTTDFTSASFGAPSAAIFIECNANSTNNPQTNGIISIGFWDATNQRTIGVGTTDNVADADTFRSNRTDSILVNPGNAVGTDNSRYAASAVANGVRLTMTVDNTSIGRYATALLLKGISAAALTFTPNTTQDGTQVSASLGFAPKLIFFVVTNNSTDNTATAAGANMSFGVAEINGAHRMIAWQSTDAASTEQSTLLYSETRCGGVLSPDANSWGLEVTTFGADTFTVTTRDGGTGGAVTAALALGGADISYDLGTLTTPTSTGNSSVSTTVAPDALLTMLSTATGTSLETGSGANGMALGMADDNGQFAHNLSVEDGATTINTNSAAQAAELIDLDGSSGGTLSHLVDGTVTLNSNNFTTNYTVVDASARKGWWVAWGAAASSDTLFAQACL